MRAAHLKGVGVGGVVAVRVERMHQREVRVAAVTYGCAGAMDTHLDSRMIIVIV